MVNEDHKRIPMMNNSENKTRTNSNEHKQNS